MAFKALHHQPSMVKYKNIGQDSGHQGSSAEVTSILLHAVPGFPSLFRPQFPLGRKKDVIRRHSVGCNLSLNVFINQIQMEETERVQTEAHVSDLTARSLATKRTLMLCHFQLSFLCLGALYQENQVCWE